MYPQKVKDLIPEIANKLNIPVEHLEMMVTGEFQAVKDAMGSWDHNMIFLERFGTFFFRVWKIENEVRKCNDILRDTTRSVAVLDNFQELKYNLIKMDSIILGEMIRRQQEREILINNEHVPSQFHYEAGCRCEGCKKFHNQVMKKYRSTKREAFLRNKKRLQKLTEYETKRDISKGLGE
jgi:hypothetical protein